MHRGLCLYNICVSILLCVGLHLLLNGPLAIVYYSALNFQFLFYLITWCIVYLYYLHLIVLYNAFYFVLSLFKKGNELTRLTKKMNAKVFQRSMLKTNIQVVLMFISISTHYSPGTSHVAGHEFALNLQGFIVKIPYRKLLICGVCKAFTNSVILNAV